MKRRRTSILFFIFLSFTCHNELWLETMPNGIGRKFIIIIFNHTGHQRALACDDAERRRKFCRQMPGVHRHEGGAYTHLPHKKKKTHLPHKKKKSFAAKCQACTDMQEVRTHTCPQKKEKLETRVCWALG